MSHTITVRLTPELAEWLAAAATETGVPQSKIIRDQLEKAKAESRRPFMRLAGVSSRRGFSRS